MAAAPAASPIYCYRGDLSANAGFRTSTTTIHSEHRVSAMSCLTVLLLSLCFVTLASPVPAAASPPPVVDFDALTWLQWRDLYDTSAALMTLENLYRSSPRVRAKVLVAKQISMDQLLAGEAILRQQLSDVAGVSIARVQVETLQTSALRASDRGEYIVAFGISAVPDPMALVLSGSQDLSLGLAAVIDLERERIIERLRYGAIVRDQNVTIASLMLFGSAMKLLDVDLDGESFYPIDLKPWLAARIAVAPVVHSTTSPSGPGSTTTTGVTAATSQASATSYQPSRDAFQNLRLRFLLAKTLLPLRLSPSDILIRESTAAAVSAYHKVSASIVDVEVHVADEAFRPAVNGYLRNASLAQAFSAVEPQWAIVAIDVDSGSGILYLPSSVSSVSTSTVPASTSALSVVFELHNVPFIQLASRKWRILERVAQWLALNGCYGCQVRFEGVGSVLPAAMDSEGASHNDGDSVDNAITPLDPINARSTTLSIHVDTLNPEFSAVLLENLQHQVASGPDAALCVSIGVQESDDELSATAGVPPATCALTWYQNASVPPPPTELPEPFVLLKLTLKLSELALNASMTPSQIAESVFDQFRIRCALLVLFQQLAVYDEHVQLEATSVIPIESGEPLLVLTYKVVIADESQRKGLKMLFLSKRFQRTLDTYIEQRFRIVDREADLHADGSPAWLDAKLPGMMFSLENTTVDPRQDSISAASANRVYRFEDPLEGANPTVLQFPDAASAPTCSSAVDSSPRECISIDFMSEFDSDVLFVREIESNVALSSPSLVLPPASQSKAVGASTTTMDAPAPRIAYTGASASYPWIFYADTQPTMASRSNSTLVILLRFYVEVTTAALRIGGSQQSKAFRLDVRVEINLVGGNGSSSNRKVSVHKASFLPSITVSGDTDGHLGSASTAFGHLYLDPFVSAQVDTSSAATTATSTTSSSGHSAVAFHIYQSSLGGFFNRATVASAPPSVCTACYAKLRACDASLECRALSACFSTVANSDPALYTSLLLSTDSSPVSQDLSWLLQQCLGGHSESVEDRRWTTATLVQFLDGLLCTSDSQCPLETTVLADGPSRTLMVRYTPIEQTLTFPQADFTATLQFLVDLDQDGERSQVFAELTRDDASLLALQDMLVELYRGQQNSSTVTTTGFPFIRVSRGDDEVINIQYAFLSTWTSSFATSSSSSLTYVLTISGDSPIVRTTVDSERLELVVVDT